MAQKKLRLLGYALVLTSGLYTAYHFLFVAIFQISLFMLSPRLTKINFLTLFTVWTTAALLYLPWIPTLRMQLQWIAQTGYFFSDSFFPEVFDLFFVRLNFLTRFFPPKISSVLHPVILAFIWGIFFSGCLILLAQREKRRWVIGGFISLAALFLADTLMKTETINIPKLSFFMVPLFFTIYAAGLVRLPERFGMRIIAAGLTFGLLLANAWTDTLRAPKLGHENYLKIFPEIIDRAFEGEESLILINTRQRRLLLSLILPIQNPAGVKIMNPSMADEETSHEEFLRLGLDRYNRVATVYLEDPKAQLPPGFRKTLNRTLKSHGFFPHEKWGSPRGIFLKIYIKEKSSEGGSLNQSERP